MTFHMTRHMTEEQALGKLSAVLDREDSAWVERNKARWTEEYARSFNADQRRKAAKEGAALPDGSFPIYKQEDADNAAQLAGKGDAPKDRVHAHIRKRVKALGLKLPPSVANA